MHNEIQHLGRITRNRMRLELENRRLALQLGEESTRVLRSPVQNNEEIVLEPEVCTHSKFVPHLRVQEKCRLGQHIESKVRNATAGNQSHARTDDDVIECTQRVPEVRLVLTNVLVSEQDRSEISKRSLEPSSAVNRKGCRRRNDVRKKFRFFRT